MFDSRGLKVQLAILFFSVLLVSGCNGAGSQAKINFDRKIDIVDYFSANTLGGFARAHRRWQFKFPKDHTSHQKYKNERWHFSGQLNTASGRKFAYQLTFLRVGLKAVSLEANPLTTTAQYTYGEQKISSKWRSDQLYKAHFTLTDIKSKQFYSFQKISRNALGLAGDRYVKNKDPKKDIHQLKIWVDDWLVESESNSIFPLHIKANRKNIGIDLLVNIIKPVVLMGNDGLFRKSTKSGDASYYYSIPRLESFGKVTIEDQKYDVEGVSWLDREWSTASLGDDLEGWDWFAVHIDNEREFMFYQLRNKNGTMSSLSRGVFIYADGKYNTLSATDVVLEVKRQWLSLDTGAIYPAAWRISVPSKSVDLFVLPMVEDQELKFIPRSWSGAVRVSTYETKREKPSKPMIGYGHVELAGY